MRKILISSVLCSLVACSSTNFDVAQGPDTDVVDAAVMDTAVVDTAAVDTTTSVDSAVEETVADAVADSDKDAGPCSEMEVAPTDAVYASAAAIGGDGSLTSPFPSISEAITTARAKGRRRVIVDEGLYGEVVRFVDSDPGVFVEGGWKRDSGVWKRKCDADARTRTVIAGGSIIAIFVENVVHPSGIRHLTARTKPSGASLASGAGESQIGVRVRGANSRFAMHDVVIEAGNGGSGTPGIPTTPPVSVCNGITDCATGGPGTSGMVGTKAVAGSFAVDGYVTGDGGGGGAGGKGFNGSPGSSSTVSCTTNCGEGSCFPTPSCPKTTAPTTISGKCGCGGAGGPGGTGGPGGGASVALFVSGTGAKVTVTGSVLRSAAGGYGAGANAGALGSSGTAGKPGEGCTTGCVSYSGGSCTSPQYYCLKAPPDPATTMTAGGNGGTGGKGGDGAGGAGGPSHAVVLVGSADALVDPTSVLKIGAGGMGLNGAPNGGSSATYIQP